MWLKNPGVALENVDLHDDVLRSALREATWKMQVTPVLCGSAFKNKGVQLLLDAVVDYLPSPVDRGIVPGTTLDGEISGRKPADEEPLSALAFKIMTDPYVGQLTFVRVYSGILRSGETVLNATRGKNERIGRLLRIHANKREEVPAIVAGNIAPCGSRLIHRRHAVRWKDPILLSGGNSRNVISVM